MDKYGKYEKGGLCGSRGGLYRIDRLSIGCITRSRGRRPGIPPRSLVRDTLASNDGSDEIAYRQPGMTRVVQAAGRVARGPKERGS
ncbi:MAG: hypothetical protein Ct9H300mP8_09700 [Gammaproteobacteria bacterium]|nr:MAG: hypothetical protein Ct9H300mP8_09700 [Gammaproteobacteria bacterium]